MYVGNLEVYQGIDLLLDAFALHYCQKPTDRLAVIGGVPGDVEHYRKKSADLGLHDAVEFRGHQPVEKMRGFLSEADVLVSPRIKGTNTPMKIYSYLDAGRPVLATNLYTHTQVLTPDVSVLVEPEPPAMAAGMMKLSNEPSLRIRLAEQGKSLLAAKYSVKAFKQSLDEMYRYVETTVENAKSRQPHR